MENKSQTWLYNGDIRVYFMRKVKIDHRLYKKGKIHPTIIKRLAKEIKYKSKQKCYHDYNEVVNYEGSRYFVVYQFHKEDVLFIKQARIVKR